MHLDGSHVLHAPAEKIWDMLLDPEILARLTPGIQKLEIIEKDTYNAISSIKIGSVKGAFTGKVAVVDKVPIESFVLKIDQKSKIGDVSATGKISLSPLGESETEVTFEGDAKLTGTLVKTGQRVISGVARMLVKKFFKSLEKEISDLA